MVVIRPRNGSGRQPLSLPFPTEFAVCPCLLAWSEAEAINFRLHSGRARFMPQVSRSRNLGPLKQDRSLPPAAHNWPFPCSPLTDLAKAPQLLTSRRLTAALCLESSCQSQDDADKWQSHFFCDAVLHPIGLERRLKTIIAVIASETAFPGRSRQQERICERAGERAFALLACCVAVCPADNTAHTTGQPCTT